MWVFIQLGCFKNVTMFSSVIRFRGNFSCGCIAVFNCGDFAPLRPVVDSRDTVGCHVWEGEGREGSAAGI